MRTQGIITYKWEDGSYDSLDTEGRSNSDTTTLMFRREEPCQGQPGYPNVTQTYMPMTPAAVRKQRQALQVREAELVAAGYLEPDDTPQEGREEGKVDKG